MQRANTSECPSCPHCICKRHSVRAQDRGNTAAQGLLFCQRARGGVQGRALEGEERTLTSKNPNPTCPPRMHRVGARHSVRARDRGTSRPHEGPVVWPMSVGRGACLYAAGGEGALHVVRVFCVQRCATRIFWARRAAPHLAAAVLVALGFGGVWGRTATPATQREALAPTDP